MAVNELQKEKRTRDPYMDRRTGQDRRYIHLLSFFANGGKETRNEKDRRGVTERRKDCMRVTKWSSVCVKNRT